MRDSVSRVCAVGSEVGDRADTEDATKKKKRINVAEAAYTARYEKG